MNDKYLFGYEILKSGIPLSTLIDAIKNGSVRPYLEPNKPVAAPSVPKKIQKFTDGEIFVAVMDANARRREKGLPPLDPGSPEYHQEKEDVDPVTGEIRKDPVTGENKTVVTGFLEENCWHIEQEFSWEYLDVEIHRDIIKTWLFLEEDISRLRPKKQRPNQIDKPAVQDFALKLLEGSPDMTLIKLATVAHQETRFGCYGIRTIEGWIRPVHPQYKQGKPGRKPKK
jgi:hypothetical protein